ncbi:MAG TPA: hypothetical protein VHP11_05240 [Tepidisphaeraceae bacterium]|nr:hypothetical protein [Tepidisphaeraceae bacterium]
MSEQDKSVMAGDDLSPFARDLLRMNVQHSYTRLVAQGDGLAEAKAKLELASPEQMVAGMIKRRDEARGMLGGLWLYHDWLAEAHRIFQRIESPTGSYWHAIMHRREGDFDNSKHWYAQAQEHPLMQSMAQYAASIVNPLPADNLVLRMVSTGWNPAVYVDLVAAVHDQPDDPRHAAAVSLQQIEWRLLFDYCTRIAAHG